MKAKAFALGGRAFAALYRACYATSQVVALLPDGGQILADEYPFGREVFALCERDALALAGVTRRRNFAVLVAHGRDGDFAAAALAGLGCRVVRGATRRGGVRALAELVRILDDTMTPAGMVVDGPLGPTGRAQLGVLWCASQTGRPVRAIGAAAKRAVVFRSSWSGVYLPLPFTRIVVACEEPLAVSASPTRAELETATQELNARLAHARKRALDALQPGAPA